MWEKSSICGISHRPFIWECVSQVSSFLLFSLCRFFVNFHKICKYSLYKRHRWKIKDSKKLSAIQRNNLFDEITKVALLVDWIIFDPSYVDKYNPKKTSIIGMETLIKKHQKNIDFCLIDA